MASLLTQAARVTYRTAPAHLMTATRTMASKHPDVRTIFTSNGTEPPPPQRVPVKNKWLESNTENYTDTHTRPPLAPKEKTQQVVAALAMDHTTDRISSDPLRRLTAQQKRYTHRQTPPKPTWLTTPVTALPADTVINCLNQFKINILDPRLISRQPNGAPSILEQLMNTVTSSTNTAARYQHNIVIADSGIGGLLFAIDLLKGMENELLMLVQKYDLGKIVIKHIGDTLNAPYGSRTANEIALLALNLVLMSKKEGSNHTTVGCNTASLLLRGTVIKDFQSIIGNSDPIVQIIDHSAQTLYDGGKIIFNPETQQEELHLAVIATPFVTKNETYKRTLAEIHTKKYPKSDKPAPKLIVHTLGPETWVHNMESGLDDQKQAKQVKADIDAMMGQMPKEAQQGISKIGLFCTHYPGLKPYIIAALSKYSDHFENPEMYISQGQIFAEKLLNDIATAIKEGEILERPHPLTREEAQKYFNGQVLSLSTADNRKTTAHTIKRLKRLPYVTDFMLYQPK